MKTFNFGGHTLTAINVPNDGYRETLVKNPNLRNRYGFLEVTSRASGLDSINRAHNIEQYEILGMYHKDESEPIVVILSVNNCFEKTDKVVVLKCVSSKK